MLILSNDHAVGKGRTEPVAKHRKRWFAYCLAGMVVLQFSLLCWHAYRSSPVHDEYGHFYAGIQYWLHGNTQMFCVNPPLIRALGTVFALWDWPGLKDFQPDYSLAAHVVAGGRLDASATTRWEFPFGQQLFAAFPQIFRSRLFWGRVLVSLFPVLATIVIYRWGSRLFGPVAGLAASACWAFQPQVLAHGSLITNDIAVAAMMVTSCFFFAKWLRYPTPWNALVGGLLLGVCTLCKFTAFLLWPIFLVFTLWRFQHVRSLAFLGQALTAIAVALVVIAVPYRFEGVGKRVGEIRFLTDGQIGQPVDDIPPRYSDRWFANIPSPVPEDLIVGIDRQQHDFQTGMISYAAGQTSRHGWWWFYLYSMLVKLPTGTLVAIAASLLFAVFRCLDRSRSWRISFEPVLIACVAISMIEITAYKSGFAQQHRYMFPLYPFLCLLIVAPLSLPSIGWARPSQWAIKFGVAMTVIASLSISPHWLGAFNLVSGGTSRGHRHLFNDATDWGQDCYFVAQWIRDHPDHRPLKLDSVIGFNPVVRDSFDLPPGIDGPSDPDRKWLIVSKSELSRNRVLLRKLEDKPREAIGASHFLYRVKP